MTAGAQPAGARPAPRDRPRPPAATLRAVAYRHGAWSDLEALAGTEGVTPASLQDLQRGGLRRYSVLEGGLREVYVDCVGETLARAAIDPADVDAVVYFSTSLSHAEEHDVAQVCRALGMRHALPFSSFLGECTNYSSALTVALSLIGTLGVRTVVLIGADSVGGTPVSRVLERNVSVFSDAVTSCVVQAGDVGDGYLIEGVSHRFDAELVGLTAEDDLLALLDRFAAAMGWVCADVRATSGWGSADVDHLVLPNLGVSALRNYAAVARVPFARVPTGNIGRFGHCFACDQLITLETLVDEDAVAPGDRVMVLGVGGNYLFSALALRRLGPAHAGGGPPR